MIMCKVCCVSAIIERYIVVTIAKNDIFFTTKKSGVAFDLCFFCNWTILRVLYTLSFYTEYCHQVTPMYN
jgi:hypothetical protein